MRLTRVAVLLLATVASCTAYQFAMAVETEDFPPELLGTFVDRRTKDPEFYHIGAEGGVATMTRVRFRGKGLQPDVAQLKKIKGHPVLLVIPQGMPGFLGNYHLCKFRLEGEVLKFRRLLDDSLSTAMERGRVPGRWVEKTDPCEAHWEIAGSIGDFLKNHPDEFWGGEEQAVRFDPHSGWTALKRALEKANPGWSSDDLDGEFLPEGALVGLSVQAARKLHDLAPLAGHRIKSLRVSGSPVTDLRPLKGLPLESLDLSFSDELRDLTPLSELPLKELVVSASRLVQLPPKLPATLTHLGIAGCDAITRLDELRGLPLRVLGLRGTEVRDFAILRTLPLKELDLGSARISEIDFLKGLALTQLSLSCDGVKDLTPLKGMPLEKLDLYTTELTDLSPLKGLPLRELRLANNHHIKSLEGLQGLPLEDLDLEDSGGILDLSPLKGAPLKRLKLGQTRVRDLSPLAGAPLESLDLFGCPVADLAPLQGTRLKSLRIDRTKVVDLTPLSGLPLVELQASNTPLKDLSPLKGMHLERLDLSETQIEDLAPLTTLPWLEELDLRKTPSLKRPLPPGLFRGVYVRDE